MGEHSQPDRENITYVMYSVIGKNRSHVAQNNTEKTDLYSIEVDRESDHKLPGLYHVIFRILL